LIGIGLIVLSLVVFVFNKAYLQTKLKDASLALIDAKSKGAAHVNKESRLEQISAMNNLLNFPAKSELLKMLESIYVVAKQDNVTFDQADFKFSELPSIQSESYEITLPITGKYLDIRKFLSQLNGESSGVVLRNIELSRANGQANVLDGVIHLSLFVTNKND
jgi:Tfp pilus assembly protein PilO